MVPDDAQAALWDSRDLRRLAKLRQLAIDTGAPDEALRLIDSATTADEALEQLTAAGLMPDEDEAFAGMLAWFTPLLEPDCDHVEAEVCGAEFIGELRRAAPADAELREVLGPVAGQLAAHPCPEALAMARVLAVVGPPELQPVAEDAAARLVAGGLTDPPWVSGLGRPRPGPCFGYADIYGEQRTIVLTFSYGRKKHAVQVLIDYVLGGGIRDCFVADYTDDLRGDYLTIGTQPGQRFSDLDGPAARQILETALSAAPCPVQPDQIEDVENYLDLLCARVRLLPAPRSAAATVHPGTVRPGTVRPGAVRPGAVRAGAGGASGRAPALRNVHRLKVTLRGIKPPIWRRFEVPSDITLSRLHAVIQHGFGWEDSHLWLFDTPADRYGIRDADLEIRSAASKKLSAVADWPGDKFRYEYDFGDGWEHDVLVEAVQPAEPGIAYPRCTAGRRACPPEDSGGVWGYSELLNVLANPRHEDHQQILSWLGIESAADFDPDYFDVDLTNKHLARTAKVLVRP